MNENIAKALVKAQAEMPVVPFDSVNPFLKNRYAGLGSVIETVRPVLAKHGLAFTQLSVGKNGEVGVKTILMHESGEFIEDTIMLPLSDEKGKSAAQVAGSIITYLRRYSLASILGVYADEDTDGNQPKPAQQKNQPAPKKAPQVERVASDSVPAESITPQYLVDNELSSNIPHAAAIVNGLQLVGKHATNQNLKIISKYRSFRDGGMDDKESFRQTLLWAAGI